MEGYLKTSSDNKSQNYFSSAGDKRQNKNWKQPIIQYKLISVKDYKTICVTTFHSVQLTEMEETNVNGLFLELTYNIKKNVSTLILEKKSFRNLVFGLFWDKKCEDSMF